MKRYKFAVMPLLILLVCLVGCSIFNRSSLRTTSEDDSGQETPYRDMPKDGEGYIVVGFSQIGSESDWRTANTESFKSTFTAENGYYLLFKDAQQKHENQIKDIRNFILQEVDYIVLDPVVETGWDAVLMEAKDAGIPVIVVDRQVSVKDESLFTCWVGSDFRKEGRRAGKWLESYLESQERSEEEIKIVTLQGTLGATSQIGRTEGFEEVLSKHKNWKMLARESGEFTQAKGQEVMENFLADYDEIDVVISENDNMTFGAMEAIEASGKTCGPEGDIIVISFDAVKAALQFMVAGKINVDLECNPLLGPMVSEIIEKLEAGKEVGKTQYVEEQYFDTTMSLENMIKKRAY